MSECKRIDGRESNQLRWVKMTRNYLSHPLSSVLVEFGGTKVICAVSVEPKVPGWMKAQKLPGGWLTCEYGMLPSATGERFGREAASGKQGGRTVEIQRLIGRSLRSVVNLEAVPGHTIYIDCDVIDADGGTRCASITGASVALAVAARTGFFKRLSPEGKIFREHVAAISVGMIDGVPMLDLNYSEDSRADVDMNVVMTESGELVEIQGTAEHKAFSRAQLNAMLDLAEDGLRKVFDFQRKAVFANANTADAETVRRNPAGAEARNPKGPTQLGSMFDVLVDVKI